MGIIASIIKLIPALEGILKIFDKWFTKTPEEKVKDSLKKTTVKRKKEALEANKAVKKGKTGDTSKIENIINTIGR